MGNDPTIIDMDRWMLDEILIQVRSATTVEQIDSHRADLAVIDAHVALVCRERPRKSEDRTRFDARRTELVSKMDEVETSIRRMTDEIAAIEAAAMESTPC
jgi:hypothetical protein